MHCSCVCVSTVVGGASSAETADAPQWSRVRSIRSRLQGKGGEAVSISASGRRIMASWMSSCKGSSTKRGSSATSTPDQTPRVLKRRHTPLTDPLPEERLNGADFADGSFLHKMAVQCCHRAVKEVGRPDFQIDLNVGSVCTGSGMDTASLHAVNEALANEDIPVSLRSEFICEVDVAKRAFARKIHELLFPIEEACAFHDLTTLHDDSTRRCDTHLKPCKLPDFLDVLIGGISCKDFARCNLNKAKMHGAKIFNAASTPGRSADTMHGFTRLLDLTYPEVCIVENVDELAEQELHREALDMFMAGLAVRGYDCKVFILNVADFGVPQIKKRMYLLARLRPGRKFLVKSAAAFFDRVLRLLEVFKITGPSLAEVLLQDDDAVVQSELARIQERAGSKQTCLSSKALDEHGQAWSAHLGARLRVGGKEVRKSDANSPWFNALTLREQCIVEYHQRLRGKACNFEDRSSDGLLKQAQFAMLDVSQSLKFSSTATLNIKDQLVAQTILPGSRMYVSLEPDEPLAGERAIHRLLTGHEVLMLNGFPTRHPDLAEYVQGQSDALLHNLGGNAFGSTIIASLLIGTIVAMDSAADMKSISKTSHDDAKAAMALLSPEK